MDPNQDKLLRENYKLKKENADIRDFVAKKVKHFSYFIFKRNTLTFELTFFNGRKAILRNLNGKKEV